MHLLLIFSQLAVLNASQLLSVVMIHRHGDRNPLKTYKTDPYRNESHWPEGFGQLSKRGKQRQYELGQWLRERYSSFLPQRYSPHVIRATSTDVDRTLMSAEVTLAGFFPPPQSERWSEEIYWQPIPVHTTHRKYDALLYTKRECRKYSELYEELLTSNFFKGIHESHRNLLEFLSEKTGESISSVFEVEELYNVFLTQTLKGKELPEWTVGVFPEKMKALAILKFELDCYNEQLARLKTGLLFGEIVKHFGGFRENANAKLVKFLMFSGHDRTLVDILKTIGAFNKEMPPYSSAIIFEFRFQDSLGYYVNAFYKNGTDLNELNIKNCELNCKFEKFIDVLQPIIVANVTQWETECEN